MKLYCESSARAMQRSLQKGMSYEAAGRLLSAGHLAPVGQLQDTTQPAGYLQQKRCCDPPLTKNSNQVTVKRYSS
jgi:hypothetical protein